MWQCTDAPEEDRRAIDVFGFANAIERRLRFDLLAHVVLGNAGCMRSLRLPVNFLF